MNAVPRDFRRIIKQAKEAGWAVYIDGRDHIALRGPKGERMTLPGAAMRLGRRRAVANYRAQMRRLGVPGA